MDQATRDGAFEMASNTAPDRGDRYSFWRKLVIPVLMIGLLIAWTMALLTPIPAAAVAALGGPTPAFWFGKTLHVSVYATLAIMAVLLPLSRNWRLATLALLIMHGGATEYLQQFVGRGSSVKDFGLDSLGICLGTGLALGARRLYCQHFCREQA